MSSRCPSNSRQRNLFVGAALALCAAFVQVAEAETYRWVGEDGKVQYGDRPPAAAETERVRLYTPDRLGSERAREALEKELEEEGRLREERADKKRLREENLEARRIAEEECRQARAALAGHAPGRRLRYKLEDGRLAYLGEEQRQERIKQLEKVVQEACKKPTP